MSNLARFASFGRLVLVSDLQSSRYVLNDHKEPNMGLTCNYAFPISTARLVQWNTRVVRRKRSSPKRDDPIWKQFLEVVIVKKTVIDWLIVKIRTKAEKPDITEIRKDQIWEDTWRNLKQSIRMSNRGIGYMPLKRLPLGWYGRNMKAISYMLNPLVWCGRIMQAISYILQQSCTFFKT